MKQEFKYVPLVGWICPTCNKSTDTEGCCLCGKNETVVCTDVNTIKENDLSEDKCAAPSSGYANDPNVAGNTSPDVDYCIECGEEIDELGDALSTLYDYATQDDEIQEFARLNPGKKLEFETIVRVSVINSDEDEMVVYAGPIVDSDDITE